MIELAKALTAGEEQTTSMTGAQALRTEDLERTLKYHTYKAEHAAFWRAIVKAKATSTVVQYTNLTDLGDAQFIGETSVPDEDDPTFGRKFKVIKIISTIGSVSMMLNETANIADAWNTQTQARTTAIIAKTDWSLFHGDSSMVSVEFDGIFKAMNDAVDAGECPAENIIDFAGKRMNVEYALSKGTRIIADNYGQANKIFVAPEAVENYEKELMAEKMFIMSQNAGRPLTVGVDPKRFATSNGEGDVVKDVFLKRRAVPGTARSVRAPSQPSGTATQGVDTGSLLSSGTYTYKVTAENNYGESTPSASISCAVNGNQSAVLTLTAGAGANTPTAYRIYRKDPSSDNWYFAWRVAAVAGDATYTDTNLYRAGCTHGILLDFDPEQVIKVRQLMNFQSFPLAKLTMADRKMFVLALVPTMYNPKKIVWLKNLGTTAWS
jgi:hypothetical protein